LKEIRNDILKKVFLALLLLAVNIFCRAQSPEEKNYEVTEMFSRILWIDLENDAIIQIMNAAHNISI